MIATQAGPKGGLTARVTITEAIIKRDKLHKKS